MLLSYQFDLTLHGHKCHQAGLLGLLELHAQELRLKLVLLHNFLVLRLCLGEALSQCLLLGLHLRLNLDLHRLLLLLRFDLEILLHFLDHGHLRLENFLYL